MFVAVAMGLASPLKSSHILWINLITDSLPALALGVDKNDSKSLMRCPPRKASESLFARGGIACTLFLSLIHISTIRERLQKAIRRLVLLSIVSLVIVSMIMNLSGTLSRLKADMQEIAKLSADRIRQELTVSETIVSELGCSYQLSAAVFTPAQKQEYINQRVEAYGMVRGKLIGSNGIRCV